MGSGSDLKRHFVDDWGQYLLVTLFDIGSLLLYVFPFVGSREIIASWG